MTRRQRLLVTIGILLGVLLVAVDTTIVATALPRIAAELNGLDLYAWVLTAYLVTLTTLLPIAGKLGDLFGRKPFLLAGMIGFVVASGLCGQARGMPELIAFRAFQGIFAGILFTTIFAVVADLYSPDVRAKLQGLLFAVFGLGSIIGPAAGGYLTDTLSWRWAFYVNLPVGIPAALLVGLGMPRLGTRGSWRDIDIAGALSLVLGLVPLLIALSLTRDHAWTSGEVLGLLGLSAVVLVGFVLIERRAAQPVLPFDLLRNPTFAVAVAASFLLAIGFTTAILFAPLVLQGVVGVSAANSGELLTPMMLGLVAGGVLSGQLITRIPYYRFVGTAGIAVAAAGLWLLAQLRAETNEATVVRDIVIVGLGIGLVFPLYLNSVQNALPHAIVGVATSQFMFWRFLAQSATAAVFGSLLAERLPQHVRAEIAALALPPRANELAQSAAGAETLFDPQRVAALRASPELAPAFDQVVHAVREGLAGTVDELFLYGAAFVAVGIIFSLFLREVPIRESEQLLRKVPLFARCSAQELRFIAARVEEREFPAGARLCTQGEPGSDFFMILDGVAEARRDGQLLRTIGPGDFFGEIALLDKGPRTATVSSTILLRCLVLGSQQFREVIERNADVAVRILDAVTVRLRTLVPAGAAGPTVD